MSVTLLLPALESLEAQVLSIPQFHDTDVHVDIERLGKAPTTTDRALDVGYVAVGTFTVVEPEEISDFHQADRVPY
jgi:hypothetical protein